MGGSLLIGLSVRFDLHGCGTGPFRAWRAAVEAGAVWWDLPG